MGNLNTEWNSTGKLSCFPVKVQWKITSVTIFQWNTRQIPVVFQRNAAEIFDSNSKPISLGFQQRPTGISVVFHWYFIVIPLGYQWNHWKFQCIFQSVPAVYLNYLFKITFKQKSSVLLFFPCYILVWNWNIKHTLTKHIVLEGWKYWKENLQQNHKWRGWSS